ncbi:TPA: ABC transporter ATP-binding protein [bacterium]|nr:MAG: ABC transporter ATP-binding protein [Candidatus Hydrogenedentes bacterium CG1_02_42_14]PIU46917.1 MAG: ABC transporter ATP-binding protein [Candidatus Hydrogenedentes bacterium CG07_land_8_20_14_0_80_42_17]HBW46317.1 ABC transporter ATP-binding protein [bacterium]
MIIPELGPPKENIIVKANNLVKEFEGRRVLDNVSFEVKKGEVLVIMGGSGCGKSTTLRILIGLEKADEGNVWLFNENITAYDDKQFDAIRKRFGVLFQSGALFNSMTVGENVSLPLHQHTELDENVIQIIMRMKLEMVGLTGFEHLKPAEISGGMKKRVGLARAIALDPELVFYDEPSAGLDPVMSAVIDELILDLKKKMNITSVVVTHHMDSAFKIADKMVMLYQGRVLAYGTPDEIRNSDDPVVQQFISGSADGPIPYRTSRDLYLQTLAGIAEERIDTR